MPSSPRQARRERRTSVDKSRVADLVSGREQRMPPEALRRKASRQLVKLATTSPNPRDAPVELIESKPRPPLPIATRAGLAVSIEQIQTS
jgi:hypothetical protein